MDMRTRLQRLQARRYDSLTKSMTLSDAATAFTLSDSEKYLVGSMEPVSAQQTEIVLKTGERVKNQLQSYLNREGLYPDFDYQGSVTNNTHIKLNSDIDLIVTSGSFFTRIEGAFASLPAYSGHPGQTIFNLRIKCRDGLKTGFPAATVTEKAKCIGISGGSLQRDVDVVPCNWIKNQNYERTNLKMYLGIRVLDVEKDVWVDNFPFLHNALLEVQDIETQGNLKRVIRLLKTLRDDASATIDVSSYDICGLAYSFTTESMKSRPIEGRFEFLERFLVYSRDLETNTSKQATIAVPNNTRMLFSSDGLKVSELKKLNAELNEVLDDVRPSHAKGLTMASPHSAYSLFELLKGR
jgi:hypothetical protein